MIIAKIKMDGKTSINECLFPKIIIFQLPTKQKELLWALFREGKTQNLTAKKFLNKYKLTASMVQAAIKGLLEKDYVSCELGTYFVYDKFLAEWMLRKMG